MKYVLWLLVPWIISNFGQINVYCQDDDTDVDDAIPCRGCSFNRKCVLPGAQVELGCFVFECTREINWEFLYINGSCSKCSVKNDPHFYTFDGYPYDFHRKCNYSISQPICCWGEESYNPPYGIFGYFKTCVSPPSRTCLHITTYKIRNDLIVKIGHSIPVTLEINGIGVTLTSNPSIYWGTIFAWKSVNCVYVVGEHYSIHACESYVVIHTTKEHMGKIAGLCGYFTGTPDDDFKLRDCSNGDFSDVLSFGNSWNTIPPGSILACATREEDAKEAPACIIARNDTCESHIKATTKRVCSTGYSVKDVERVIDDCRQDCCGADKASCEKWANVGSDFLCALSKLNSYTIYAEGSEL